MDSLKSLKSPATWHTCERCFAFMSRRKAANRFLAAFHSENLRERRKGSTGLSKRWHGSSCSTCLRLSFPWCMCRESRRVAELAALSGAARGGGDA
jgi:hypothetical protein